MGRVRKTDNKQNLTGDTKEKLNSAKPGYTFKIFYFIFNYVCVCWRRYADKHRCLWRVEEGVRSGANHTGL